MTVVYDRTSCTTQPMPWGAQKSSSGWRLLGCFSMSLAQRLDDAGFHPSRIETSAEVHLGVSPELVEIAEIRLACDADVGDIDDLRFQEIANITKRTCVVARALMAVPVTLDARLIALGVNTIDGTNHSHKGE